MATPSIGADTNAHVRKHFIYLHVKRFTLDQSYKTSESTEIKAFKKRYLDACDISIAALLEHSAIKNHHIGFRFPLVAKVATSMIVLGDKFAELPMMKDGSKKVTEAWVFERLIELRTVIEAYAGSPHFMVLI